MEENDKINLENIKIRVSYLNNIIKDFEMPSSLDEFRIKVKSVFQISNRNEEIFITYPIIEKIDKSKSKEVIIEIKRNEEYISLLNKISEDEIKDNIIFIETTRVPEEISRDIPKTFEEEIECLIKTHLSAAGERIKKSLSGRKELYQSSKIQDNICYKCKNKIAGNIFRGVADMHQRTYCEKCSYFPNMPMFVIH